jgi:hypothetical protein
MGRYVNSFGRVTGQPCAAVVLAILRMADDPPQAARKASNKRAFISTDCFGHEVADQVGL